MKVHIIFTLALSAHASPFFPIGGHHSYGYGTPGAAPSLAPVPSLAPPEISAAPYPSALYPSALPVTSVPVFPSFSQPAAPAKGSSELPGFPPCSELPTVTGVAPISQIAPISTSTKEQTPETEAPTVPSTWESSSPTTIVTAIVAPSTIIANGTVPKPTSFTHATKSTPTTTSSLVQFTANAAATAGVAWNAAFGVAGLLGFVLA